MTEGVLPRFGAGLRGRAAERAEPVTQTQTQGRSLDITNRAEDAVALLKALGHEGRLLILCHLVTGEKSVTEIESLLSARQAAVSQQLARLRLEGLVQARRDGQQIHYSIRDRKVVEIVALLNRLFCELDDDSLTDDA